MTQRQQKLRRLTATAMLAAVSTVLMFFSFNVPFMPPFIKMDFSELPALIATFSFGPVSGVLVCLVKNLVNLLSSTTGGVGELSNFLLGVLFVVPAGIVYKKRHTKKAAVIAAFAGAACMALISIFINYFIVYPIYYNFLPQQAVIAMYQAILPSIENMWQALIIFNLPFTFIKGCASIVITVLIYKPLAPIIKGK